VDFFSGGELGVNNGSAKQTPRRENRGAIGAERGCWEWERCPLLSERMVCGGGSTLLAIPIIFVIVVL